MIRARKGNLPGTPDGSSGLAAPAPQFRDASYGIRVIGPVKVVLEKVPSQSRGFSIRHREPESLGRLAWVQVRAEEVDLDRNVERGVGGAYETRG